MLACPAPQLYMYEETVVGNLEVKEVGLRKKLLISSHAHSLLVYIMAGLLYNAEAPA